MRILITGATGFVGNHLRNYLLNETDWQIFGTTYPDPPPATPHSREQFILIDLRDPLAVETLLDQIQPDAIIHLAAQSHVPTAYAAPWETLENNIRGQLNLSEACVHLGLKPRILIIGSGEEYGRADAAHLPLVEDHPLHPENPYSVSKVAQDMLGYQYFISYNLPVIRMRPFNHIGPGQSPRFVLPAFASQIARIEAGLQEPVLRVGNLEPARDFTDVRDVVRAYYLALLHGRAGEAYNVSSGVPRTIQSLLDQLLALAQVSIRVEIDPQRYRPADVPVVYASSTKLSTDTGWIPTLPIEQTVREVLADCRLQLRQS